MMLWQSSHTSHDESCYHVTAFYRDDFAPFLLPDDEESNADAHFEQYCSTIESTAAWGGHVELQALSHALKRQIKVGR